MITRGISTRTSGYAVSQYDYASICIFSRGKGLLGTEAKITAATHSKKVLDTLREFEIPDSAIKTSFKLKEWIDYVSNKEGKFAGYQATHHITVFVSNLNCLAELQDELTNIANIEVEEPKLHLAPATKEKMQETAFARAFEKAQRRLKHECEVLGFNTQDYSISSYNTDYKQNYREELTADVATSSNDVLEFHAGAALVCVELTVYYRHKDDPGN